MDISKLDEIERVLISEEEISTTVEKMAKQITKDYKDKEGGLVLLGILKGSVFFLSDLSREIELPLIFDFMSVSSYGLGTESSGDVRILKDLDQSIDGKHVIIVEDIIDTGYTLSYLIDNLKSRGAKSIKTAVLLDKKERRQVEFEADYVGYEIPDEFVVGYGIDYAQKYRNLPFVGIVKEKCMNRRPNFEKRRFNILPILLPIGLLVLLLTYFGDNLSSSKNVSFYEFVSLLEEKKVDTVETKGNSLKAKLKDKTQVATNFSFSEDYLFENYLKESVEKKEVKYSTYPETESFLLSFLPYLIMIGGSILLWYLFISRSQAGNNQAMNFGKNRATLNMLDKNPVTFKEVAGLKEEKEELMEIVEFLKLPQKYVHHGARIPKGVLLVGPPGTGKTYISKAVAGEAKVPFYSISGSDFVEMFVGVGASRVRDMFKEAKKNSPCIIFIDEIDAVGRRRGAGLGGGHDEREQTLNQLLVEMDGFATNEGIIIMAATNRPDILDPALLRPGRFDRQIKIGLPDVRERYEILQVHTRNKHLSSDVDLKDIAKTTSGFSPADLENITNEAALLTARFGLKEITPAIFDEATIRVVAGPEKKSKVVIEKERKLTAYHEAGHAVVTHFLEDTNPVHMITIIPRGSAGGFTSFIPEEDTSFMTKKQMFNDIVSFYGGRAAEELVLDDISTGASNDIERATKIAKAMVTTFGMSDGLGPIMYGQNSGDVFLGRDYGKSQDYSDKVALEIDEEVRKIIKDAYQTAKDILNEHMDFLHDLATNLLEKETIRKEEFLEIARKYDPVISKKDVEDAKRVLDNQFVEDKTES